MKSRLALLAVMFCLALFVSAAFDSPQAQARNGVVGSLFNDRYARVPLLYRPNRPGHFVGNTVRGFYWSSRRAGWR
jgi:hypothetical protein